MSSQLKKTNCLKEATNILNPETTEEFCLFVIINRIQWLQHHSGIKYTREFHRTALYSIHFYIVSDGKYYRTKVNIP